MGIALPIAVVVSPGLNPPHGGRFVWSLKHFYNATEKIGSVDKKLSCKKNSASLICCERSWMQSIKCFFYTVAPCYGDYAEAVLGGFLQQVVIEESECPQEVGQTRMELLTLV